MTERSVSRVFLGIVALAILLGLGCFAYSRILYYSVQLNPLGMFDEVRTVGDTCSYGVGAWTDSMSFKDAAEKELLLNSLPMPYRRAEAAKKPKVGKDEFLKIVCPLDLSDLRQDGFAWLRLQYVHGESAVFLSGTLRQTLGDLGVSEFPLLPEDRVAGAELIVISRPNALKSERLGLPTAMPIFVTDDRQALAGPDILAVFDGLLRPAFWINFSLTFFFIFLVIWLGGIRRADVGWMVVAMAANAGLNVGLFVPDEVFTPSQMHLTSIAAYAVHIALICFAARFLRLTNSQRGPTYFFLSTVGLVSILRFLDSPVITASINYSYLSQALGYGVVGIWSTTRIARNRARADLPTIFVAGFCLAMAASRGVDAFAYGANFFTMIEIFIEIAILTLCAILIFDLTVSHHKFLSERFAHQVTAAKSKEYETIASTTQMLAHDVRRPYSLLRAGLSQLSSTLQTPTQQSAFAELQSQLDSSLHQTDQMLTEIMDFGHSKSLQLTSTPTDRLIAESMRLCLRRSHDKALSFAHDLRATQQLQIDESKMIRVVSNLFENAIDATPDGGTITFSTTDLGAGKVSLSLHNSGSYIAPADREQLFEPFFTKGKARGTGLGLVVVKRIVQAHGGTIQVESKEEGGTTFTLTLPATQEPRSSESVSLPDRLEKQIQSNRAANATSQPKIALIEDNAFFRDLWAQSLASGAVLDGYAGPAAFTEASSSDLKAFAENYDLIIVDYYFDEEQTDGLAFAEHLRSLGVQSKMILSSDISAEMVPVGVFDSIVGKEPLTSSEVQTLIEASAR